ncbi:MAG: hypothetical protein ACI81P_001442 [Neolewinella sp.]|jgi:hypothetical protein
MHCYERTSPKYSLHPLTWGSVINSSMDTSITHIRPRFKFRVSDSPEEVMAHIRTLLATTPAGINGKIVGDQIVLDITGEDVHYWSPQLDFRVEEDEDLKDTTIIAGLIGPRPAVWTLFMFICFSIGFIGFFATSYGISRYMVEDFSLAIWGLPVAVLIMLTAYQAGKFGERLGAHQVEVLKQFVREAVGPALD